MIPGIDRGSLETSYDEAGETDGPGIYDLRSPLGKISESLGECAREGVVKVRPCNSNSAPHYAKITPTKLAKSYSDAGYFTRNLRAIEVLVDQELVRNGRAANEPWKFLLVKRAGRHGFTKLPGRNEIRPSGRQ